MRIRVYKIIKILLNVFVVCLIVFQSNIIIKRASIVAVGHLLAYVNDLVSMIFLLIYLNINIKIGTFLYLLTFIFYFLIQFIFVTDKSTGMIVSSVFRVIVIICLAYSWPKDTVIKTERKPRRELQVRKKSGTAEGTGRKDNGNEKG
jgi:hypothetical protein